MPADHETSPPIYSVFSVNNQTALRLPYYVAVARRKDVQDEFATELTQEQAEHFTELMKLLWEENDYGLIEAFRQGIKFGIKLMEEINT